jgi:hypothetical protein
VTEASGQLVALTNNAIEEITAVAGRPWPRENSAVREVTDSSGGWWIVKRHPPGREHGREVPAHGDMQLRNLL